MPKLNHWFLCHFQATFSTVIKTIIEEVEEETEAKEGPDYIQVYIAF